MELAEFVNDEQNAEYNTENNLEDKTETKKRTKAAKPVSITNYTPIGDKIIPITRSGAFIKFSQIDESKRLDYIRKIENHFTLRIITITGNWKQSKRCTIDRAKERIIVPRFGVFEILNSKFGLNGYTTNCQINIGPEYQVKWEAELNDNQKAIAKYILKNIYTPARVKCGSAGLVLNLQAGQGKSFLAAYLISVIEQNTAIIVHSTSMIEQWHKVLLRCFPDADIGMYYNKVKKLGKIMIILIDSAIKPEFIFGKKDKTIIPALQFYSQFGFIIYDECHLYANNNDGKVFNIGQAQYVLGLSATPDENANKFDRIHTWSLGPVLDARNVPGYVPIDNEFKATVHRIQYYGPPDYTHYIVEPTTGILSVSKTLSMISEDMLRASLVVDCTIECLKANLFTYVFADRREYLELLRKMLTTRLNNVESDIVTDEKDFMRLVGGSKSQDLEHAEISSKCIFTTYQYGATGRSIIKMNALVLATPRKSGMKQTIGRILRLGSDTKIERQIYDIVDMKIKLNTQWSSRKQYYVNMGFNIVEQKVSAYELRS